MIRWLLFLILLMPVPAVAGNFKPALKAGWSLTGKFVQERHLNGFTAPMVSEGRFVVVPSKGLIWYTEKPFETTMIISPQGIRQTVAGEETLRVSSSRFPALKTIQDVLEATLTGNWSVLEKRFGVKPHYVDQLWTLEITPNRSGDKLPLKAIQIIGQDFVNQARIERRGKDIDIIVFSNQKPVPDDMIDSQVKLLLDGWK